MPPPPPLPPPHAASIEIADAAIADRIANEFITVLSDWINE